MPKVTVTIEAASGSLKYMTPEEVIELRDLLLDMYPIEVEDEAKMPLPASAFAPKIKYLIYSCPAYPFSAPPYLSAEVGTGDGGCDHTSKTYTLSFSTE